MFHLVLFQFSFVFNNTRNYFKRIPPSFTEYYYPETGPSRPGVQSTISSTVAGENPHVAGCRGAGLFSHCPTPTTAVGGVTVRVHPELGWHAELSPSTARGTGTAERGRATVGTRSGAGTGRQGPPPARRVHACPGAHLQGHRAGGARPRRADGRPGKGAPPGLFRRARARAP